MSRVRVTESQIGQNVDRTRDAWESNILSKTGREWVRSQRSGRAEKDIVCHTSGKGKKSLNKH